MCCLTKEGNEADGLETSSVAAFGSTSNFGSCALKMSSICHSQDLPLPALDMIVIVMCRLVEIFEFPCEYLFESLITSQLWL